MRNTARKHYIESGVKCRTSNGVPDFIRDLSDQLVTALVLGLNRVLDGQELRLSDFEVGVTMRPVRVPKLDSDYFEEE